MSAFTLAQIGDTQVTVQNWPNDFDDIITYLINSRQTLSLAAAIHMGDLIEWPPRDADWQRASAAVARAEAAGVPFFETEGNHEFDQHSSNPDAVLAHGGTLNRFNQYFPSTRISQRPGFGGSFPEGKSDNVWYKLDAGERQWLVLTLEFNPQPAVLAWGASVVASHPDRSVIIVTHEYLNGTQRTDVGNRVWSAIAGKFSNVFAVMCGHNYPQSEHNWSTGAGGNKVLEMIFDYQDYDNREPNSYVALLRLDPEAGTITRTTYSPTFKKYRTGSKDAWTLTGVKFPPVKSPPVDQPPTPTPGGPVAIPLWSGVTLGGADTKIIELLGYYPQVGQLQISSGTDSDHGTSSYHYDGSRQLFVGGSPANALDVVTNAPGASVNQATMRDVAKWAYDTFPGLVTELIHTTPFPDDDGFYIKDGQKMPGGGVYGAPGDPNSTAGQHGTHVHLAMSTDNAQKAINQLKAGTPPTPPPPTPTGGPLFGVDASDFNSFDVTQMAADGIAFFTHKLTEDAPEGVYEHVLFAPRMRAARDAGIKLLGAYVVPRSGGDSPEQEASVAVAALKRVAPWLLDEPDFFWQIDIEKWSYDAVNAGEGDRLAAELERLTGKSTVLYASAGQYGNTIPGSRPLWNANYKQSGASRPYKQMYAGDAAPGWLTYSSRMPLILQYASDAVVGGQGPLDINAFRGSVTDFQRLISRRVQGTTPGPVPTPTPDPPPAPLPPVSETERKAGNADVYGWQAVTELRDQVTGIRSVDGELPPIDNQLKKKLDAIEAKLDAIIAKLGV